MARLGGDEFAILQVDVEGPESSSAMATRLIECLSRPYVLDGSEVVISASIGIVMGPMNDCAADDLMKNADLALYRAKAEGRRGFRFFEADMDLEIKARRALEVDLRKALAHGEFQLYFQPIVDVRTLQVSGFEALLRWHHPIRGMVSPAEFIPIAEDIGLISALGEWVLRQACAEAATWPGRITVAVNLSPAQFKTNNLVEAVQRALTATGLSASRLELEITETVLLSESDATLMTLHQLRALGIRIAMDDFGTGYSSLSYLRSFPFDKIKIDQSFVRELSTRPDCINDRRVDRGTRLEPRHDHHRRRRRDGRPVRTIAVRRLRPGPGLSVRSAPAGQQAEVLLRQAGGRRSRLMGCAGTLLRRCAIA